MADKPVYNLPPFGAGSHTRQQIFLVSGSRLRVRLPNWPAHFGSAMTMRTPGPLGSSRSRPVAQVRMFADAVTRDHPLHAASVAQWRGFAFFARTGEPLFGDLQSPIQTGRTSPSTRWPNRRQSDRRSLFERVLTRLPPLDVLPQESAQGEGIARTTAQWNRPFIMSHRNGPAIDANGRPRYEPGSTRCAEPCLLNRARAGETASIPFKDIPWLGDHPVSRTHRLSRRRNALPTTHYVICGLALWLYDDLATISGGNRFQASAGLRREIDAFRKSCATLATSSRLRTSAGRPAGDSDLPPLYAILRRQWVLSESPNAKHWIPSARSN